MTRKHSLRDQPMVRTDTLEREVRRIGDDGTNFRVSRCGTQWRLTGNGDHISGPSTWARAMEGLDAVCPKPEKD